MKKNQKSLPADNPTQHCTRKACVYTINHTAWFCGLKQKRRCGCSFCYPAF